MKKVIAVAFAAVAVLGYPIILTVLTVLSNSRLQAAVSGFIAGLLWLRAAVEIWEMLTVNDKTNCGRCLSQPGPGPNCPEPLHCLELGWLGRANRAIGQARTAFEDWFKWHVFGYVDINTGPLQWETLTARETLEQILLKEQPGTCRKVHRTIDQFNELCEQLVTADRLSIKHRRHLLLLLLQDVRNRIDDKLWHEEVCNFVHNCIAAKYRRTLERLK